METCTDILLEAVRLEPQILGAEGTRRLTTHVYGLLLNGYSYGVVRDNVKALFRVSLSDKDIIFIQSMIDFETNLASTVLEY